MICVESFGVTELAGAVDAVVEWVPLHVQLQGGRVEDVGQVEVLLSGDVGQISLGFVHGLGQAELSQMFLEKRAASQKGCGLTLKCSTNPG